MSALDLRDRSVNSYRRVLFLLAVTTVVAVLLPRRVAADPPGGQTPPPPPAVPPFISPPVFCFRITDIRDVPGDLEGNAFDFEIEVLNWTNASAFQLDLSLASPPRGPTPSRAAHPQ